MMPFVTMPVETRTATANLDGSRVSEPGGVIIFVTGTTRKARLRLGSGSKGNLNPSGLAPGRISSRWMIRSPPVTGHQSNSH